MVSVTTLGGLCPPQPLVTEKSLQQNSGKRIRKIFSESHKIFYSDTDSAAAGAAAAPAASAPAPVETTVKTVVKTKAGAEAAGAAAAPAAAESVSE